MRFCRSCSWAAVSRAWLSIINSMVRFSSSGVMRPRARVNAKGLTNIRQGQQRQERLLLASRKREESPSALDGPNVVEQLQASKRDLARLRLERGRSDIGPGDVFGQ